jgi:hypothetical protein
MMAATSACMRTGVDNPEIGCPIQIGKPRMLYGYTTGIPCHGYRSNGRPNNPTMDIQVLIAESIHMIYDQVPVRDATQDMQ